MVHEKIGDLLEAPVNYICHQVNCMRAMNSGIAKQIRNRWPIVYNKYIDGFDTVVGNPLGMIQIIKVDDHKAVVNMFSQLKYGYDHLRYTNYEAFYQCLTQIKTCVPPGSTIGFPKRIGCDRGGANWTIIKTMIEEVLGKEYEVYIYELHG